LQGLLAYFTRSFHDFIIECDSDGQILSIWSSNGAVSHAFRRSLIGRPLGELAGPRFSPLLRAIIRRVLQGPRHHPEVVDFSSAIGGVPTSFRAQISRAGAENFPSWVVIHVQDVTSRQLADIRLRASAALVSNAAEIAEMGVWETDLASQSTYWSPETFRLYGLAPVVPPQQPADLWPLPHFKHARRLRRKFAKAVRSAVPFRFSDQYTRPDGSIRKMVGAGAPVTDDSGKVVRVVGVIRDITHESHTAANLRRLSDQLLKVRSDEQRRMGRELHETTAQTLAALKMTLGQIGRSIPARDDRIQKLLRSSEDLARNAVREVRFVSSLLHPPLLDEAGLPAALRTYARLFAERGGLPITVQIQDDFGRLDEEIELAIFRIAQESLTNVQRHARAARACVRVNRTASRVAIQVKDDGVGFAFHPKKSTLSAPLGVGIVGMRERVEQMGGHFQIITAPRKGTTVRAWLPIHSLKETADDRKNSAEGRIPLKGGISRSARRRPRHRSQGSARVARTRNRP
jgi:PAS domain S-box-containing protein